MRCSIILTLLSAGLTAQAQIKVEKLNKAAIPTSITFKGHVVDGAKFSDKDGEHLVVLTETGVVDAKSADSEGSREAALYAYDYKVSEGKYILNWQQNDFVEPCELDVAAKYRPNTFSVTDLNNDGVAEVWTMYKTQCTGDVSPALLKVIMHEGAKKYAMRGESLIKLPGSKPYGGKYTLDAMFKAAPTVFRTYAINLWNKNMLEKFDQ